LELASIRRLSLSRRLFRDDLLSSRVYASLFLMSSILVVGLTFLVQSNVDPSKLSLWIRIPWTALAVFGTLGLFFLWIGMWWYWVRLDASSGLSKRVWFVVLLAGFWYGSILYYFSVYLPQVVRRRAVKA
jgi:hypothetical protein